MSKVLQLASAFSRLSCSGSCSALRAPQTPALTPSRYVNFFSKHSAEDIWKGITSVSPQGRKRGRAKGLRKLIRNLNKGQVIGVGRANIVFPGLSSNIIQGKEIVRQHQLPKDPDFDAKLAKIRDTQSSSLKSNKLTPLERGYTGSKMPGRSIGPPDPIGEQEFEGFDVKVVELKPVSHMRATVGRFRRVSVTAVCGNKNGVAGFAQGKAVDGKTAMRKAKNRSGQRLMFIERYNDHTICHDFYSQFGRTKIFAWKRPEGYGLLKCHRVIRTICELVGIKDMEAKVENATNNPSAVVKAFFLGLLRQRTPQQLSDEVKLHLVEFRKENDYCPRIVASPTEGCDESKSEKDIPDYDNYIWEGRVVLRRKKFPPFFANTQGYNQYLRVQERKRGMDAVKRTLRNEYGEIRSFLAEKYPECRPPNQIVNRMKAAEKPAES
ncbi:unnamed protein product [Bemisia tabaci]|uniref:Small ribosomal subunit protein uS5m n=1 Tax=Bemisia tabaci TaxID=7038 RepID=A0A9P0F9Q2_BEMTA|nr:unnamed protein product [Bemisia tabaci]